MTDAGQTKFYNGTDWAFHQVLQKLDALHPDAPEASTRFDAREGSAFPLPGGAA